MSLCSVLTQIASIRSLARSGWGSLCFCGWQQACSSLPSVLEGTAVESSKAGPRAQARAGGQRVGRTRPFILLLSFAISVRMAGLWPLNHPDVFMCLLGIRHRKEFSPLNVSCVIFLCLPISSIIQQDFLLPHPHEMTLCLKCALKYSTKEKKTPPQDPAGN